MTADLRQSDPIHGFWSTTAHPSVVEVACSLHPDFLCIDAQHGIHISDLTTQTFTTMAYYDLPGLVRVASNHPTDIGRALDLGAEGVMVPMIETVDDARRAVAAITYGSSGSRSYGMQTPRVDPTTDDYQPLCALQIETAQAIENIEEIASVEGVDWLYIGPADLGLGLGGIPAPDVISVFDGTHPLAGQINQAFDAVVVAASNHGKLAGLHCGSGKATLVAQEHGFAVSSVAADLSEVRAGMSRQLDVARSGRGQDSDR